MEFCLPLPFFALAQETPCVKIEREKERKQTKLPISHQEINLPLAHITTEGFSTFPDFPIHLSLISENKEDSEVLCSLHTVHHRDGEERVVNISGGGCMQQTG